MHIYCAGQKSLTATASRLFGLGSDLRRDRVAYVYKTDSEVIECELLHEFQEAYQIHYVDSKTGEVVEKVVSRDYIQEIDG